jgi:hypothetical protein
MYFKDTAHGGTKLEDNQIVSVAYTATLRSSGAIIDTTDGGRLLTLAIGSNRLPLFLEAVDGMAVGGKRRLKLPPSSKFASLDEDVLFDLEVIEVKQGLDALAFRATSNTGNIVRTAILLSFVPDILGLLGVIPDGSSLFDASSFGAVDVLGSVAPVADAANQWAAQGLQGLF